MKYQNANDVLPGDLLLRLQGYIEGGYLYIPARSAHKKWGENSGARRALALRNREIAEQYRSGRTLEELAEQYFLSVHSIRQIVYKK